MGKPAEAWYPYVRNIAYRYPHNRHPEEDAAFAAAFETAAPETRKIIEIVFIKKSKTMHEAANMAFISYPTAQRRVSVFFKDVAIRLGLPASATITDRLKFCLQQYPHNSNQDERKAIAAALEESDNITQEIIKLAYIGKTETLTSIAKRLGISNTTAHSKRRNFMQSLAEKLPSPK